jgi:hypothetical protein
MKLTNLSIIDLDLTDLTRTLTPDKNRPRLGSYIRLDQAIFLAQRG